MAVVFYVLPVFPLTVLCYCHSARFYFMPSIFRYVMMRKEDGSIRGTIKMIESLKLRSMDHDKLKRGEGG